MHAASVIVTLLLPGSFPAYSSSQIFATSVPKHIPNQKRGSMSDSVLIAHVDTERIDRNQLALMPTPAGTATHKVIPHIEVVNAIVETLVFRHFAVHRDEYAVSKDGNKCFG